jgi:hypothetical protein
MAFHADPGFESSRTDVTPFKPLLDAFEDEAVAFGKPVLLVAWVRIVVTPGVTPSFAFEQRLVPRWKYW